MFNSPVNISPFAYKQGVGFTNSKSILLDGISKFVNIDSVRAALAGTTEGTFDSWIKPVTATPAGFENIIAFGDTDADSDILVNIFATTGVLQVRCRKDGVNQWSKRTTAAAFTGGVWSHWALVVDGVGNVTIYINAVAVAQAYFHTLDKNAWFNSVPLLDNGRVGCINTNSAGNINFFNGNLDEVKFTNRALTQPQIADIYNSGAPKDETGIANGVSQFRFDGDTVPICGDSVGSNNGTYVNCVQGDIVTDVP